MTTDQVEADTGRLTGRSMLRKEDLRLLTGRGRFLEDLRLPGTLYGRILRSPHAHARIVELDVERARRMPGVHAVLTGRDLEGRVGAWGHQTQGLPQGERTAFAVDKVVYEGQEVAAVVAETRHQAADALEAIAVTYERLPPVMDAQQAMADDALLVQPDITYPRGKGNVYDIYTARIGDITHIERDAAVHVRQAFATNRTHGSALESHGCVADFDAFTGKLTIYSSTQSTYLLRDLLADALGVEANRIRAVAVDVGAGFGSKADMFQYEVIAAYLAMQLGRPVQFVLSRAEIFRATSARAGQVRYAELFAAEDGKLLGYRDHVVHNTGAASMWGNQTLPLGTHIGMASYPVPNVHIDGFAVHTNSISGGALRGFGVPQLVWTMEQLVDMVADALDMDPVDVRLANVVRDEQCPYRTPMGHIIDSTSIAECIEKAAEVIDWRRKRAAPAPNEGMGFAICLKHSSARHPSVDSDLSSVRIKVESDGTVTLYSSDVPHGQGHETMLSQLVGDILGVDPQRIQVISSDTDNSLYGLGTWGSRGAVVLGSAAESAAKLVRERMLRIASHLLEVSTDDLEVGDDRVYIRGVPDQGLKVGEIAVTAALATHALPPDVPPGSLEAVATYDTPTEILSDNSYGNISVTYSGAAHACRVKIDPETGVWEIVEYVMVHDSGTVINPLIVDGQHQGGFLHGYGMVYGEGLVYDDEGRMVNPSFGTYAVPYAPDTPALTAVHEVPAPSRSVVGGRKGAGETATAPVPPAVANALYHATGVRFTSLPITPDKVLDALAEKERRGVDRLMYPYEVEHAPGPHTWPGE